jgi:hypothetical protein
MDSGAATAKEGTGCVASEIEEDAQRGGVL